MSSLGLLAFIFSALFLAIAIYNNNNNNDVCKLFCSTEQPLLARDRGVNRNTACPQDA